MMKPRLPKQAPLLNRISLKTLITISFVHLWGLATVIFIRPSLAAVTGVLALYFLFGGLGLGVGYHRMASHQSFQPKHWVEAILGLFGVLSFQTGPLTWAALHRAHHRYEDQPGDPHAVSRGYLWSHILWSIHRAPNGFRYRRINEQVPDLAKRSALLFQEKHWFAINLVFSALIIALFGIQTGSWLVAVRILLIWHTTWLINSFTHSKKNATIIHGRKESARNVWWIALLTFGEGWHLNHHRAPKKISNQETWYQIDINSYFIRLLLWTRLARR